MNLKALQNELSDLADDKIATHSQRFFKTGPGEYGEGDIFCGIRVPVLRTLAKKYRSLSMKDARQLFASSIHEHRLLALFILTIHFEKGTAAEQKKVFDLYIKKIKTLVNNWDLVDSSAHKIVGAYLWQKPAADRKLLTSLAKSKNLWERRVAMVSTYYEIKKDSLDTTTRLAKLLLHDSEDLMHKAVGWMLREAGKRDESILEIFLQKHYEEMPRTMLRYAIERLPEPRRQAFLKGYA